MITPRFWLTQTENTVTIFIRAPYCALKDLDVSVEDDIFLFSCTPYYLRLKLPGRLEDNENYKSSFDSDKGEFAFTYDKLNHGEHFPNLELITKLLQNKLEVHEGNKKIEILTSSPDDITLAKENNDYAYGFALRGGYNFKYISSEFNDVFDVDPFTTNIQKRKTLRIQEEERKFSPEHYLADTIENNEIEELSSLKSPWKNIKVEDIKFNDRELDFLKDLPNKSHNLTEQENILCKTGLIDILYAYCYDRRTTYFEGTCESGWTICKIAATLSWFESFSTLKEALISGFRRSLIYPLYREFNLCQCILRDLRSIVKLGPKYIVKCLINIYDIFLGGSCKRYILNNLYIKDYIIYVIHTDDTFWSNIVNDLEVLKIEKTDLGLNLIKIEETFLSVNKLEEKMKDLILENTSETDSDDSCSDSETDQTDTSDDESDNINDNSELKNVNSS